MNPLFDSINDFFGFIQPISDAVWNFPTQFLWYAQLPVLGKLSFAVALLLGVGVYFTIKTRGVQRLCFARAIRIMRRRQHSLIGISPLGSFMLGLAMRVGPGNVVGVTGAISVGGPGALFWM